MLVDSHCHLNFPEFRDQLPEVLARMHAAGVMRALCVCVEWDEFEDVLAIAERFEGLYASVGVHPDYDATREPDLDGLVERAGRDRVVAIGETGLDYYRLTGDLEWQRERFRIHIRAARRAGKPLIIHTRSAGDDTLRILREEGAEAVGGVMHCFTESLDFARAAMELNFMISFSGIVTFKNARALQDVARQLPDASILIETDSPYLAPVPLRGKTNEPAYVAHVARFLAQLRATSLEHIAAVTTENFDRLFKVL